MDMKLGVYLTRGDEDITQREVVVDHYNPKALLCWRSSATGERWYNDGSFYIDGHPQSHLDLVQFVRPLPEQSQEQSR